MTTQSHNNTQTAAFTLLLRPWLLYTHLLLRPIVVLLLRLVLHATTGSLSVVIVGIVARGISRLIVWLSVILMLWLMVLLIIVALLLMGATRPELHVHAAFVLLSVILKTQFAANLLHARLDLLNMIGAVVAFAHDHVKM